MAFASLKKMEFESFLRRCAGCGQLRGEIVAPGSDAPVRVPCRCLDGRCPRCRGRLTAVPFTVSADDIDGMIWHRPHLGARCASCGPLFLTDREA